MEIQDIIKYNQEAILDLKDKFRQSKLAPRIVCLIVHGSSLFYPLNEKAPDSDIDLELILKESQPDDYLVIKEIIKQAKKRAECQLRYLNEIEVAENLIFISEYKLFMYFAYANSVCLIGHNVYQEIIKQIPKEKIKKSFITSAQIYFKDVRKSFLKGASPYLVNKNIIRVLVDIGMAEGFIDYHDLGLKDFLQQEKNLFIGLIIKNYSQYLTKQEVAILKEFINKYEKKEYFPSVFQVIEKVVKIFEKNIKDK